MAPPPRLRIVHITDTHLLADKDGLVKDVCSERALERVLAHVRTRSLPADLLIATGDLADDGSHEAYERLKHHLHRLEIPVGWLPGNHDDPGRMHTSLRGPHMHGPGAVRLNGWVVLLLNSVVPGDDGGFLGAEELARLEAMLAEDPSAHTLVALHHPPVAVGTPKMDAIGLRNRDELFAVIDRHRHVHGILWGHFHHAFDDRRDALRLMGTPSTCYQLRLGGPEAEIDALPPGYREIDLTGDGEIATRVVRVA
jgi:Icc protein